MSEQYLSRIQELETLIKELVDFGDQLEELVACSDSEVFSKQIGRSLKEWAEVRKRALMEVK
jgi:hypothetical protein